MKCLTYCFAYTLDIKAFETALRYRHLFCHRQNDYLIVTDPGRHYYYFFFTNGTCVVWNQNRRQAKRFLQIVKPYTYHWIKQPLYDGYLVQEKKRISIAPHPYFNVDILSIDEWESETLLALSYGFSRSIKLRSYEQLIEKHIEDYTPIVSQLASKGHIKLSRKEIQKIIGTILQAKSLVNLKTNYAAAPKFFWQSANLEEYFVMLERYLDMQKRISVLNYRLDVLNEIFVTLNHYLEARHSHFLEWLIIALIAAEILLSLLHYV